MQSLTRTAAQDTVFRRRRYPLQKTILFATPTEGVPYRLRQAIENELWWAVIAEVPDIRQACVSFRDTVSIILVDASLLDDVERHAQELRRHHPLAPVMLLLDRNKDVPPALLSGILESRVIRGILPLESPTDLMISVISMMLRGGEYFPRQWFRAVPQPAPVPDARTVGASRITAHAGRHSPFQALTRREHEVLHMVSKGLQNKAIADALALSEHTVKIHIHNIISKLGAHNRTQASSMFRDYRDALSASS